MEPSKIYLQKLKTPQLSELADFIVTQNFDHHAGGALPDNYSEDIKSIREEEEVYYQNSQIFIARNNQNNIIGAIRVLKWNFMDELPIQKIFGINPLYVKKGTINDIYHIGRFAISKEMGNFNLFKKLMMCAIAPVCNHNSNIVFAECDSRLLRTMTLLGIKTEVIGESIDYLGSETIPVCMTGAGLMDFYQRHINLLPEVVQPSMSNYQVLSKSLVPDTRSYNYHIN